MTKEDKQKKFLHMLSNDVIYKAQKSEIEMNQNYHLQDYNILDLGSSN